MRYSIRIAQLIIFAVLFFAATCGLHAETHVFHLTQAVGSNIEEMTITVTGISWIYPKCPDGPTSGEKQYYKYRRDRRLMDFTIQVHCQILGGGCHTGSYDYGEFQIQSKQVVAFTGQPNCYPYPMVITSPLLYDVMDQNTGTIDYEYHYVGENTIFLQVDLILRDIAACPPNTQGNVMFELTLEPEYMPEEALLTAQNNPDPDRPDQVYWEDKNCKSCSKKGLPSYRINSTTFLPSFTDIDQSYHDHGNEVKFERYFPTPVSPFNFLRPDFPAFGKGWGLEYETGLYIGTNNPFGSFTPDFAIWLHPDGKEEQFSKKNTVFLPDQKHYRDSLFYADSTDTFILHEFKTARNLYFRKAHFFLPYNELWYHLVKIVDQAGITVVDIEHDTNDLITRVTDGSGRQTLFSYNLKKLCNKVTVPDGRSWTFNYNDSLQMTGGTDLLGNVIVYTYDPQGYISSMKVNDAIASFTYQFAGYLGSMPAIQSITNLDGKTTTFTLNSMNGTLTSQDPDGSYNGKVYMMNALTGSNVVVIDGGLTTTKEYNADRLPLKITNGLGGFRVFEYDSLNNVVKYTSEDGIPYRFTYNKSGSVASFTDAYDRANLYYYDSKGFLVHVKKHDNTDRYYTYNEAGQRTSYTNALGQAEHFYYDQTGKMNKYEDALGRVHEYFHDPLTTLLTSEKDPMGRIKTYTYDNLDRLTKTTFEDGSTNELYYDCCAQTGFRNELGNLAVYPRDPVLGMTRFTDMKGNSSTLNYNANGLLSEITFPPVSGKTSINTYSYTPFRKISALTDENGKSTFLSYDAAGNLSLFKDENGNETIFTRSVGGRIENITMPGQLYGVTRKYDAVGFVSGFFNARQDYSEIIRNESEQIVSVSSENVNSQYVYDAAGRVSAYSGKKGLVQLTRNAVGKVVSQEWPGTGASTVVYDNNDEITEYTYPEGALSVKYQRDNRNRITAVIINNNETIRYTLDVTGNITEINLPNQVLTTIGYDDNGQISTINHKRGGITFIGFEFVRDSWGNITSETRIMPNGTGCTIIPADTGGFYQEGNQITNWQNNTYVSDADGNLVSSSGIQNFTLTHNSINLLTSVNSGGTTTNFYYDTRGYVDAKSNGSESYECLYDHLGRMILRKDSVSGYTDYFIYDDHRLIAMLNSGGTYYYLYNQVGSTFGLVDAVGNLVNVYNYNPWGKITYQQETVPQPFKFCGALGVREELPDFYCMKHRFYNAYLGRFLEVDPLGYSGSSNLYTYADNNPSRFVDPKGLFKTDFYVSNNAKYPPAPVDPHQVVKTLDMIATICDVASNFIPGAGIGPIFADWWDGTEKSGVKTAQDIAVSYFTDVFFGSFSEGHAGAKYLEGQIEKHGVDVIENVKIIIGGLDNAKNVKGVGDALMGPSDGSTSPANAGNNSMDFDYGGVKGGTVILE
ncbi:MAG: hypothetical protein M0P47_12455 [Bacteroidales bacterium]|nr:hypothetical protein [Bacteroidales bacterium]